MTLALTSLSISHFRSHKALKLSLDGRPVAIHGPNGSGKTNILEAVSMLSPGRGIRRASAQDMTRRPESLGWKVRAELSSQDHLYDIETWSENGNARQLRIDGKTASQVTLGRVNRVLWLIPSMDRLWIEGAEGRRRFLDRATMSFVPAHAEAVLKYEKSMRERNRLLKEQVTDVHWYRAIEAQMAAAGAEINANRNIAVSALTQAQRAAETRFPTAGLDILFADGATMGPEVEGELLDAFATGRSRDMAAGRTLAGPHRADLAAVFVAKDTPAKDCSTGEQKALLVSLILANARALTDELGAPPILLLDEIAAHLDAGRRADLYDEIIALGAQAWMTGTGPELFNELGPRANIIALSEDGRVIEG